MRANYGRTPLIYRTTITVIVALCLNVAGCSPRDFLSRRLAGDLISESDTFKRTQQFFLRMGVISNQHYLSPEYLVLQRRGWITGVTVPCVADIGPAPCWDVALTPIGVETFHDLIPAGAASKQYFPIQIARRELVLVTGISRNGNLAEVDFMWRWVPMNEVGEALMTSGVSFRSAVGFKHYDDGWRVVESSTVNSNQGMEDALKNPQPAP